MPGWDRSGRRIQLLPPDYVARPAALVFAVDKSLHFERRFGYVAGKDGITCLLEDWLHDDWKLAAEASSSASLAELEKAHRRFGSRRWGRSGADCRTSAHRRQGLSVATGAPTVELGLGLQRLLFRHHGGFTLGAELGFLATVGHSDWRDDDNQPVGGLHAARLAGGYLRLTLGGGGFFFR